MSKIQWTDETWNPVTGCTKVSEGCRNCYAEKLFPRVWRDRKFTDVVMHQDRLDKPLHWRKPRRVFVNSMSDLFHEDVSVEFVGDVFETMRRSPQHVFQVLTKRPASMRDFMFDWLWSEEDDQRPLPNVWLGVSVEDQKTADERIPLLLDTPAAVRFVSAEPLLGPIDFRAIGEGPELFNGFRPRGLRPCDTLGIDWVIVGGESGPKARPCNVAWIRSIAEQCKAALVPCFVKQLGAKWYDAEARRGKRGSCAVPVLAEDWQWIDGGDRKGGDPAEWPEDLRVREWPA